MPAENVVAPDPQLDVEVLRRYLAAAMPGTCEAPVVATLIAGGRSNLTYEVTDGVRRWALRRPPLGHVLASAHDMRREVRVLRALAGAAVPVPRVVLECRDETVLGSGFYLMDFVDGDILRGNDDLAALTAAQAAAMSYALVDTLADLHRVDPAQVGLADFGRPVGFLERQLQRWARQLAASQSRQLPDLERLGRRLGEAVPTGRGAGIVHGDFRHDNVIFGRGRPGTVSAVLDWEMATLGDPLTDLGMLFVYWEGWAGLDNPIAAVPGDHPGFPAYAELLERYVQRTDTGAEDISWYQAFAFYKIAVILEGIHFRYTRGLTVGPGFGRIGAMVAALAGRGLGVLDERSASWTSR